MLSVHCSVIKNFGYKEQISLGHWGSLYPESTVTLVCMMAHKRLSFVLAKAKTLSSDENCPV